MTSRELAKIAVKALDDKKGKDDKKKGNDNDNDDDDDDEFDNPFEWW